MLYHTLRTMKQGNEAEGVIYSKVQGNNQAKDVLQSVVQTCQPAAANRCAPGDL